MKYRYYRNFCTIIDQFDRKSKSEYSKKFIITPSSISSKKKITSVCGSKMSLQYIILLLHYNSPFQLKQNSKISGKKIFERCKCLQGKKLNVSYLIFVFKQSTYGNS